MAETTPQPDADSTPRRSTRRAFLGAAGATTGAAVVLGGPAAAEALERRRRGDRGGRGGRGRDARQVGGGRGAGGGADRGAEAVNTQLGIDVEGNPDRFSRIFDDLDLNRRENREMRELLTEVGRPGGPLDANDPVDAGAAALIATPSINPRNPDNPAIPAGYTYLGQFLDHDITLDAESRLGRPVPVRRSMNLRSARLDLDSVYGGGPGASPDLYDDTGRFVVASSGTAEDHLRDNDGTAVIPDARNDENVIVSGIHAAVVAFHNAVMDQVEAGGLNDAAAFTEARRLVCWHWQWIVANEYVPLICGAETAADIRINGRRVYTDDRPRIPVEFQTSTFRFGHSQVRPAYRVNDTGDGGGAFTALIFDPETFGDDDPDDLTGGHRAPRRFVGWQNFFDLGAGTPLPSKAINPRISSTLFRLPAIALASDRGGDLGPRSLATRNLLRHLTWEIPTGQTVARSMGEDVLAVGDLAEFDGLDSDTPLWIYVLREAEVIESGAHLGPVGGRLTAEVLLGVIEMDPASWMQAEPGWSPTLPAEQAGDFRFADLLRFAGLAETR